MMPPEMMRSAAPDFGDHGREHRAHDTIRDQRPNEGSGGLATDGQYPFPCASWPRPSTGQSARPTLRCKYVPRYALRHLSNLQCPAYEVTI